MRFNPVIIDSATLMNCDCMEYMATLPDKAFDLAIVDPPYGIGGNKNTTGNHKKINWDDNVPTDEYFDELRRVSNMQIIWGANYFRNLIGGMIVWNKLGTDIGRRKQVDTQSDCEIAYVSEGMRIKMFSYAQIGNVFGNDYQIDWNQNRIHPTQKPIKLYEWLLTNYAQAGDKILDTHGGSFSSAIACNNLGFDFTGIELDSDYYEAAVKRVSAANQQLRMFA